jgi:ABC-type uncharacterized transport system permease subunit
MQTYFFIAAALFYMLATFLSASQRLMIAVLTLIAWLLHGIVLWVDMISLGSLHVGFAAMLSVALWVSVAVYWLENRHSALDGLRMLVLPCAAIAVILPLIFPGTVVFLGDKSILYSWHIIIAMLAYSTYTIAAFHAVLMALQESRLHTRPDAMQAGWLTAAIDRLPALLTMEKLLFRLISFGFVLLTLTVLSGIVFSEALFGQAFKWDHKTVFTLLSWLLFGILLAGRKWHGWRGKIALRFTLAGFSTLLLAYVGSRFVLEVVLHRGGV